MKTKGWDVLEAAIQVETHLLAVAGPGSLPHHETFGLTALLVRGSNAAARWPHVRHLRLIFHNV